MQSDLHMRKEHGARADNREKNNLAQFKANVDEEILKGHFSQNKK